MFRLADNFSPTSTFRDRKTFRAGLGLSKFENSLRSPRFLRRYLGAIYIPTIINAKKEDFSIRALDAELAESEREPHWAER